MGPRFLPIDLGIGCVQGRAKVCLHPVPCEWSSLAERQAQGGCNGPPPPTGVCLMPPLRGSGTRRYLSEPVQDGVGNFFPFFHADMRVIDGTIHIKYVQPHSNVQFKRSRVAIRARQQALFALVFHLSVGVAGLVERYRPYPVVQIIGAVCAL